MKRDGSMSKVLLATEAYLSGSIDAMTLVRRVDSLIAEGYLGECEQGLRLLVSDLQDELSLLVSDVETRAESPGVYFCEDELPAKVHSFLAAVEALLRSSPYRDST